MPKRVSSSDSAAAADAAAAAQRPRPEPSLTCRRCGRSWPAAEWTSASAFEYAHVKQCIGVATAAPSAVADVDDVSGSDDGGDDVEEEEREERKEAERKHKNRLKYYRRTYGANAQLPDGTYFCYKCGVTWPRGTWQTVSHFSGRHMRRCSGRGPKPSSSSGNGAEAAAARLRLARLAAHMRQSEVLADGSFRCLRCGVAFAAGAFASTRSFGQTHVRNCKSTAVASAAPAAEAAAAAERSSGGSETEDDEGSATEEDAGTPGDGEEAPRSARTAWLRKLAENRRRMTTEAGVNRMVAMSCWRCGRKWPCGAWESGRSFFEGHLSSCAGTASAAASAAAAAAAAPGGGPAQEAPRPLLRRDTPRRAASGRKGAVAGKPEEAEPSVPGDEEEALGEPVVGDSARNASASPPPGDDDGSGGSPGGTGCDSSGDEMVVELSGIGNDEQQEGQQQGAEADAHRTREKELLEARMQELTASVAEGEARAKELEQRASQAGVRAKETERLEARLKELSAIVTAAEARAKELEQRASEADARAKEKERLEARLQELSASVAAAEERAKELEQRASDADARAKEKERLEARLQDLSASVAASEARAKELEQRVGELTQSAGALGAALTAKSAELEGARRAEEEARARVAAAEAEWRRRDTEMEGRHKEAEQQYEARAREQREALALQEGHHRELAETMFGNFEKMRAQTEATIASLEGRRDQLRDEVARLDLSSRSSAECAQKLADRVRAKERELLQADTELKLRQQLLAVRGEDLQRSRDAEAQLQCGLEALAARQRQAEQSLAEAQDAEEQSRSALAALEDECEAARAQLEGLRAQWSQLPLEQRAAVATRVDASGAAEVLLDGGDGQSQWVPASALDRPALIRALSCAKAGSSGIARVASAKSHEGQLHFLVEMRGSAEQVWMPASRVCGGCVACEYLTRRITFPSSWGGSPRKSGAAAVKHEKDNVPATTCRH
eukprot:m51a1_g8394 hypothetical protein (969) ;mRNA; f:217078-220172